MTAATRLAGAVYSALDIPHPARQWDVNAYCDVLKGRTESIRDAVEGVCTDADAAMAARLVRDAEQSFPITYPTRPDGGGPR